MYKVVKDKDGPQDTDILGKDAAGHTITATSHHRGYPWYSIEVGEAFAVHDRDATQMRNAFNSGPRNRRPELNFKFWMEDGVCWCKRYKDRPT